MTLALVTDGHALPFNHDFYAAVGGVIPLLFIALAVEGRLLRDLITALSWTPRAGVTAFKLIDESSSGMKPDLPLPFYVLAAVFAVSPGLLVAEFNKAGRMAFERRIAKTIERFTNCRRPSGSALATVKDTLPWLSQRVTGFLAN
jgi:hypothetical protein